MSIEPRCHNKPFRQCSDQELQEELAYWQNRIDEAQGWGGALSAAKEFSKEIRQILSIRENDKRLRKE
jgi:hypothetical protein